MLFNSIDFLIFFPAVVLIYFVVPKKWRWVWLLVCSYYFYMCWNPRYSILLLTSTILTWVTGILLEIQNVKAPEKQHKKAIIACSIICNLAILAFFKYFYFIFDNLEGVLAVVGITLSRPSFDIVLPVGISFYTFMAIGYTIDVYRGTVKTEKNFFRYALFVSFFPQLVSGPIGRAKDLLEQIHETHCVDVSRIKNGLLLMLWGFFQKLVIADRAAILVNQVYDNYELYAGFQIVVATVFFAVQIYCDFAGYSNLAVGAAQVLGFRLIDNFKRPYFALSVSEFWHRWHISLSTWFRDYLYIPMGGSRCSKIKKYRNLLCTFLVSGLWHGASWTYVVWGGLNGLYQVIGDAAAPLCIYLKEKLHVRENCFSYRLFQALITFSLITFSWLFFRAESMEQAFGLIRQMLSVCNLWIFTDQSLYQLGLDRVEFWILVWSTLALLAVDLLQEHFSLRESLSKQNLVFRWAVYLLAIFSILIFGVYGPAFDAGQFIYLQF